jgi:hypothetical protein
MKRGPDHTSNIDEFRPVKLQKLTPTPTVTKSWIELLEEVNLGNYEDFRTYLKQEKIADISMLREEYLLSTLNDKEALVNIGDVNIDKLIVALKDTQVTSLCLRSIGIDSAYAEELCIALGNTNITNLNLGGNPICEAGLERLCIALKNTNVTNLDLEALCYEDVTDNDFMVDSATLCIALTALKNTQVTALKFGYNGIGDTGVEKLGEALKGGKITTLDLRGNGIGVVGAEALAICIPGTSLLKLILEFNHAELDEALKKNSQEITLKPYYLTQAKYYEASSILDANKLHDMPQFACGIFKELDNHGLSDVQNHILSFLPLMNVQLAKQYQALPKRQEEMEVETQSCFNSKSR